MSILNTKFLNFIGFKKLPNAPWKKYYPKKYLNINVYNESIYQYLKRNIVNYKGIAIEYFGTKITYKEFLKRIDECASSLYYHGVRKGDIATIISANIPEALITFYALNKIGAVVNFLHPLLSCTEIKTILKEYSTAYLFVLDKVYPKIKDIICETDVFKTIILSPSDSMPLPIKLAYKVTNKVKLDKNSDVILWHDFIKYSSFLVKEVSVKKDTPAIIMQSGGSTGTPKGIVLSNGNINAATTQARLALPDLNSKDVILGIMPIFHGFGLEVSIHDAFSVGAKVVLIPKFKAKSFHKLIKRHKPTVLVGVPTLFEALTKNEKIKNIKLNQLKYVITGGDTLNKNKVEAINDFLHKHGAKTNFTQGYGLTEAVAAVSFDLKYDSHPGSIGIPWPGTYIKIVGVGTTRELPYGSEGEICITGPTVMLGYYNNLKETNLALRVHDDGNIWLHSGDLGVMDSDGFIYYKGRIKRMIVTSGYNVYPSQIEEVLETHPAVLQASVIGISHPYKVEVPKAYVVLKDGYQNSQELTMELLQICEENLANYAIPKEIEYRKSLPKTIVGKVDFRALQLENKKNRMQNNNL